MKFSASIGGFRIAEIRRGNDFILHERPDDELRAFLARAGNRFGVR